MSTLQADKIYASDGSSAPDFPAGLTQTGMEYIFVQKNSSSTGLTDAGTNDVVFNSEIANTFTTSEYSTSTGIFTATRNGIYLVSAIVQGRSDTANSIDSMDVVLVKNGSSYVSSTSNHTSNPLTRISMSFCIPLALVNADTFKVTINVNVASGTYTLFGDTSGSTSLHIIKIG